MDMDKDKLKQLMLQDTDYLDFWDHYPVDELRFPNRKLATFRQWLDRSRAARTSILKTVLNEGAPAWKNPYFYVQDFPEPQPEWKTGGETDEDLVQVRYNGAFKLCTRATMELFDLQWVRDW
jgi:hypothetical protein